MQELQTAGSRILIVDDTPQSLGLLEKMLRDNGYHVFAMTSGESAIQTAFNIRPELILLDIRMPGMDGYEVCAKLKEKPGLKDIPVIFLSALNETDDKIKGFKSGGVDYITKPFQLEEVEARVKTHLTIRKLQQELQTQNANLEKIVEARTEELTEAYKRLKEIERIKSDFLSMISHELRTPLNGILGVGDMIFCERQKAGGSDELGIIYKESRNRIEQLLNDAMIINELDLSPKKMTEEHISLDFLLGGNDISVIIENGPEADQPGVKGDAQLLKKAVGSILKTSMCFNTKKDALAVKSVINEKVMVLNFPLDNLNISQEHADSFFDLASISRQCSKAQSMGISPVVARKIVELFGGEIKMIKLNDSEGVFVLTLPA